MSSKPSTRFPSKRELIADLKSVIRQYGESKITRNFYRGNGKYKESHWEKHFTNFGKFLEAAGYVEDKPLPPESIKVDVECMSFNLVSRIQSLDDLIKHFKVDTSIWEVKEFVANSWEMGYTDRAKSAHQIPLYQVKASFRKRANMVAILEEIEDLKNELKSKAPIPKFITYSTRDSGNLLELMLPDLHAGKLSWSKETGYQDYDLAISVATYRRAVDSLVEQAQGYKVDKIILGVGNDLLQTDNIQGTTYSGTKVDTDSRYHKVYKTVRKMLCETVEKLRLIAPVEVKLVPGNHDTLSTFTMGDSLECMFWNYPDVFVDNSPNRHKTVEWGKCFLILTHGHEGKQTDYGMWMASTYPEVFGNTKFREIHVGHKHKTALDEKFGVRVRTLSALCPPDAWHANNNFTGNLRTAEALIWNKERGLVAQFYHNETD
jgi:hypothetical protein